jgi:hypothetical protein
MTTIDIDDYLYEVWKDDKDIKEQEEQEKE